MTTCDKCGSGNTIRKGPTFHQGAPMWRFLCKDCGKPSYGENTSYEKRTKPAKKNKPAKLTKPKHSGQRTFVITSATNDVPVNWKFFNTLKNYCSWNNAELIIVPIKYQQGLNPDGGYSWPDELHPYFESKNIKLCTGLRLLAGTRVMPAIGNPLSGFECFSKGDSIVIPHAQLQMKSIAVSHVDPSAVLTTTGSMTDPVYTPTKQGEKASFNHSFSAIVVEEDADVDGFHFRVLNSDETGSFYDLDRFYDADMVSTSTYIPGIVLGDEHIIHSDPEVVSATFTNVDSIVNTLKPKFIIRHDSLDFYSANHHHQKNVFTQYAKYISGKNNTTAELALTIDHVLDTTPEFSKSVIISSNHNEALLRWLQEANPKLEPWNSVLYHELTYLMLKKTSMGQSGAEYPNPFELWAKHNYSLDNVQFVNSYESFKVHGIECAFHGDKGTNGSRGSAIQFSKLGSKSIVGHSHSPAIFQGCYQVGHSCYSKLEYNQGPSSWGKAHCLIQPNGKRQILFIINGKYRR
jgi:hypothetical protein